MWRMISPPIWKRSWTKSRPASSTGNSCCAISGRISPPPLARPRISRSARSSTNWIACWRPHIFPAGADGADPRKCPACADGRLNLKLGRFGAFVGCTNYPECKFTRQLGAKPGEGDAGPRELGLFPGTRRESHAALRPLRALRATGRRREAQAQRHAQGHRQVRRGPGVGGQTARRCRAKWASIRKTARKITANFGRFGPYVAHNGNYASLESPEDVFRSASITPSRCWPKRRPRAAAAAARRP